MSDNVSLDGVVQDPAGDEGFTVGAAAHSDGDKRSGSTGPPGPALRNCRADLKLGGRKDAMEAPYDQTDLRSLFGCGRAAPE